MIDCGNLLKTFGVSIHLNWGFQWPLSSSAHTHIGRLVISEKVSGSECDALTNLVSADQKNTLAID